MNADDEALPREYRLKASRRALLMGVGAAFWLAVIVPLISGETVSTAVKPVLGAFFTAFLGWCWFASRRAGTDGGRLEARCRETIESWHGLPLPA